MRQIILEDPNNKVANNASLHSMAKTICQMHDIPGEEAERCLERFEAMAKKRSEQKKAAAEKKKKAAPK